ncbi:Cytosine permease [bioreactor metagenome]|uniref:Cytosine permease n=1 Tax=bioreactor metagenome TaxID=1076179 RepID=A0A645CLI5_9ZZZZ
MVGTWVSGSSRAADYFRWSRSAKDSTIAAYFGFFFGLIICLVVGALWGAGTGSTDIGATLGILGGGMLFFGVIMFFLQTWTTNEHSAYVSSTALPIAIRESTGRNPKRRSVIVAVALISVAFSGLGVEAYYIPFISFLGIFIPVIGAIVLSDFYIISRTKFHWTGHKNYYSLSVLDEDVQHHKFNWVVVPSLIVGFLFGWKSTFGIAAVNSLVGTMIIYCTLSVVAVWIGSQKKEMVKNEALALGRR